MKDVLIAFTIMTFLGIFGAIGVNILTGKEKPLISSVVYVGGDPNNPLAHGSGVLISNNIVLTNRHVVESLPDTPEIMFSDSSKVVGETVLVSKGTLDLSVIRIPTTTIKPAPITCRKPVHGEDVTVVGYPLTQSSVILRGIVAALTTNIEGSPENIYTIIQAPINKGNSGGAAFDTKGNLLGIVTAFLVTNNFGFMPENSGLGLIQPTYKFCDVLGLK